VEILTTALPDGKKGEKVVLLIAGPIDADQIQKLIDQSELNPLMKPSQLIHVDAIPKLGSGKNNFSQAKQIAIAACA
jgi:acyl-[acyl-carrier-protein]-phospholipid O-acyltransferase/long-chain-fatty-acid--[acyl-carrier-protein] ligase